MRRGLMTLGCGVWLAAIAGGQEPPAPGNDPAQGFLPKQALGVAAYQAANPTHDGRGVRVAIIDTGVDLLHPGLQRTSTGGRKLVGYYDATDAGDIDTSVERGTEGDTLVGLTGRTLTLGAVRADDGQYRCGVIRSARVFPPRLHGRLQKQAREARAELERRTVAPDPKSLDATAKARRADRAAADKADPGLSFDCLTFRVGDVWHVVVDTDADGDLADETPLRPFDATGDIGRFPDGVHLGFAVDVRDGGDRTVLLFDGGGHGTHVAGIVGAWYAEGDPLNGLAPGCEMLAVKCGNTRLGGPTSHLSIVKAIDWACRNGADVINISFGGDSFFRNGREVTARYVDDAVRKFGVPVVFSAGNNGPARGTIGTPSTSWRAWSIGAWAPASTQEASYGVAKPLRGRLFDFSSRGPTNTGAVGVDFIAPGAAVSPLPTWHLTRQENWNGTSMAAPQAAGALAVILSAAKAERLTVTHARLRAACTASARRVADLSAFEQGAGLLQVQGAIAELARRASGPEPVRIAVRRDRGGPAAGIVSRDFRETTPWRTSVFLDPDLPPARTPGGAEARAAWAATATLTADVPWLEVARVVDLTAAGAWLPVTVLPDRLSDGCNDGTITGRSADGLVAFRVPATVIRPARPDATTQTWKTEWQLAPGDRRAAFVAVPLGATQVRVTLDETGPHRNRYTMALHTPSGWHGTQPALRKRVRPAPGEPAIVDAAVEGGSVLEIVAFSRWQESRAGNLRVTAEFHGVTTPDASVHVPAGRSTAHWRLRADLRDLQADVAAAITHRAVPLRVDWTTSPDPLQSAILEGETLYEGVGAAELVSPDGKECRVDMQFDPQWADYLDDAFWEAFDAEGRAVGHGHFWSGHFDFDPPHAGTFALRFTITERGRTRLDKGGVIAPRVLYSVGRKGCTLHASVDGELPDGGRAPNPWRLERGVSMAVFARLPKLDGAHAWVGEWTLTDRRTKLVLARAPLEVAPAAPGRRYATKRVQREIRNGVDALLAWFALDEAGAARLEELIGAAKRHGISDDDLERWYVGLTVRRPDATEADLDGAEAILDARAIHDGGELGDAKRAELVWVQLARAEVRARRGEMPAAWRSFHASGILDPDGAGRDAVELRLHVHAQDWVKALPLARKLLTQRADDHGLALTRWRCYQALGWADRMAEDLATWTDRFPRRAGEVFELAAGQVPPLIAQAPALDDSKRR